MRNKKAHPHAPKPPKLPEEGIAIAKVSHGKQKPIDFSKLVDEAVAKGAIAPRKFVGDEHRERWLASLTEDS